MIKNGLYSLTATSRGGVDGEVGRTTATCMAATPTSTTQEATSVQMESRFTLNELPEEPYVELVWNEKVDAVWAFVFARKQARSGHGIKGVGHA
jgi:hypothetical protein